MLRANIESSGIGPIFPARPKAEPGAKARLAAIAAGAMVFHGLLAGFVAWSEMGAPAPGATAAVEIPVEMATPEEAEGRAEPQQPGKPPSRPPAAIEPQDDTRDRAAEQKAPQAAQPAGPTEGKVVERPRESEKPQMARTRGAEARPEEQKDNAANPFGGLTAVEKPAAAEPLPMFASPQSTLMAARPRPAADPTNDNYRAKVLGKVAANMIDPERPRPKALAIVGFRVDAQGNLESAWLARPSGHADLDAEALDMVRRSAPFPAPPAGADHNFAAAIAFGEEGG